LGLVVVLSLLAFEAALGSTPGLVRRLRAGSGPGTGEDV